MCERYRVFTSQSLSISRYSYLLFLVSLVESKSICPCLKVHSTAYAWPRGKWHVECGMRHAPLAEHWLKCFVCKFMFQILTELLPEEHSRKSWIKNKQTFAHASKQMYQKKRGQTTFMFFVFFSTVLDFGIQIMLVISIYWHVATSQQQVHTSTYICIPLYPHIYIYMFVYRTMVV